MLVGDEREQEHGGVQEDEDGRDDAAHHLSLEEVSCPDERTNNAGIRKPATARIIDDVCTEAV